MSGDRCPAYYYERLRDLLCFCQDPLLLSPSTLKIVSYECVIEAVSKIGE